MKGRQGQRVRLYVRATILGYRRSKSNQYENTSLLQIEGMNTKEEVGWYAGMRIAYVYKAKTKSSGSTIRCIWGKVTRPHGNSGVVRAKFRSNLPPTSVVSCCKTDSWGIVEVLYQLVTWLISQRNLSDFEEFSFLFTAQTIVASCTAHANHSFALK